MPKYFILMREQGHAWARMPLDEQERLLPLYYAWVRELRGRDLLRGGEALAEGGRVLRAVEGRIVEEPFAETGDVPTGFFLIEAPDMTAAVEVARGCPALTHGENLVVREVTDHSA